MPCRQELLQLPALVGESERSVFESVFQGMDKDDDRAITVHEFASYLRQQGVGAEDTPSAAQDGRTALGSDPLRVMD
eukprot:COSAG05_NODE_4575_length_1455_cov_11.601673_2_plen_76_part_01